MGVLDKIGQGLVSFGSGIPQAEIDNIRARRDINEDQAEISDIQLQNVKDEPARAQAEAELRQRAASGDPEALQQFLGQNPGEANKILEGMGVNDQNKREEVSVFADDTLRTTDPVKRQQMILERAQAVIARGGDPRDTLSLLNMSPEEQNQSLGVTRLAALSVKDRIDNEGGANTPAGQLEFRDLIKDMTPADQKRAERIKAGLDPRAGQSADERIALNQELTDLVAGSKAQIREEGKFAETVGADRAKRIDAGFDKVQKIQANTRNLEKALSAIERGATTGTIENAMGPSVRASTLELEQIEGELGLDVVGAVSFGALSEGELNLAKQVALPKNMQPEELTQWVQNKIAANNKLSDYYSAQIDFLDQGGTVAGFLRQQTRGQEEAAAPAGPTQVGRFTVEEVQ